MKAYVDRPGGPLRDLRLATPELPEVDRWPAYLSAMNDGLFSTALTTRFHASVDGFFLGPIHLVVLDASPRRSERTAALCNKDRHDGVSFQYIVAGKASVEAGGRAVASVPGTILLLDYKQPFSICDEADRTVINLTVPRHLLRDIVDEPATIHGMVLDTAASALLGNVLQTLAPALPDMRLEDGPVFARIALDLIAITLRTTGRLETTTPRNRQARLLHRAHQLIDAHLGSSKLTPEWLAEQLHVSRSDLYGIFQGQGGVSKAIWRRRVEAAREALLDPSEMRRIGELSFAFGYSSEAHFARAFRSAFGITASEARRRINTGLEKKINWPVTTSGQKIRTII